MSCNNFHCRCSAAGRHREAKKQPSPLWFPFQFEKSFLSSGFLLVTYASHRTGLAVYTKRLPLADNQMPPAGPEDGKLYLRFGYHIPHHNWATDGRHRRWRLTPKEMCASFVIYLYIVIDYHDSTTLSKKIGLQMAGFIFIAASSSTSTNKEKNEQGKNEFKALKKCPQMPRKMISLKREMQFCIKCESRAPHTALRCV